MTLHKPSKAQLKVMTALAEAGGCVDRFGRVIAAGVTFSQSTSNAVLHAVAAGLVSGCEGTRRLQLTPAGRDAVRVAS